MLRRRPVENPGDVLRRVTLDDAVDGLLGKQADTGRSASRLAARLALTPSARRFCADIERADAAIATGGLAAGADSLLRRYAGTVIIEGLDHVPPSGPLIVVANHPGTVDTPAVWAALAARPDLRVIALDRPFLRSVPHIAERLLYVSDAAAHRSALVRRAVAHLREGGALLTFPAGETEPDPAIRLADAQDAVAAWSRSPELFARLVPGAPTLPIAVAGVLSRRALAHPVARGQATPVDRELAASTWQLIRREKVSPRVVVGPPLGPRATTAEVTARMRELLATAARA